MKFYLFLIGFFSICLSASVNNAWAQKGFNPSDESDLRRSVERAAAARRALENARKRLKVELADLDKGSPENGINNVETEILKLENLRNKLKGQLSNLGGVPELKPVQVETEILIIPEQKDSDGTVSDSADSSKWRKLWAFGKKEIEPDLATTVDFDKAVEVAVNILRKERLKDMDDWRKKDARARAEVTIAEQRARDEFAQELRKELNKSRQLVKKNSGISKNDFENLEKKLLGHSEDLNKNNRLNLKEELVVELSARWKEDLERELKRVEGRPSSLKESRQPLLEEIISNLTRLQKTRDARITAWVNQSLKMEMAALEKKMNQQWASVDKSGEVKSLDAVRAELKKDLANWVKDLETAQSKKIASISKDLDSARQKLIDEVSVGLAKIPRDPDSKSASQKRKTLKINVAEMVKEGQMVQEKEMGKMEADMKAFKKQVLSELSSGLSKLHKVPDNKSVKDFKSEVKESLNNVSQDLVNMKKNLEVFKTSVIEESVANVTRIHRRSSSWLKLKERPPW